LYTNILNCRYFHTDCPTLLKNKKRSNFSKEVKKRFLYRTIKNVCKRLLQLWLYVLLANRMNTVKLELPPDEAGDVLTVRHLAQQVCIETGVDLWNQILTFKG